MAEIPSRLLRQTAVHLRYKIDALADCSAYNPWDFCEEEQIFLVDKMIENGVGTTPIPLGIVPSLIVNNKSYIVPMATEEPSVIAAASFAANLFNKAGGITATSAEPVIAGSVYLHGCVEDSEAILRQAEQQIEEYCQPVLASMKKRGGGWRDMSVAWLDSEKRLLKVRFCIACCDAMGANMLNALLEHLAPYLQQLVGGVVQMSILTNRNFERKTVASCHFPISLFSSDLEKASQTARRFITNYNIALLDEERAVTHNKGIMNGITALALATGNDSRALEACVHAWAHKEGRAQPLSHYHFNEEKQQLECRIELPLLLASVGGAIKKSASFHWSMDVLGCPSAQELCTVAAALGLVQNFAALRALSQEGIQQGHMNLHKRRQG